MALSLTFGGPALHEFRKLNELFKSLALLNNLPAHVKKDLLRSKRYSKLVPVTGIGYLLAKNSTSGDLLAAAAFQLDWDASTNSCFILLDSLRLKKDVRRGVGLNLIMILKTLSEEIGLYDLRICRNSNKIERSGRFFRRQIAENQEWDEYVFEIISNPSNPQNLQEPMLLEDLTF